MYASDAGQLPTQAGIRCAHHRCASRISRAHHKAARGCRYLALFTRRPQAQAHLHEAILQRGAVRSLLALAQGSPSAAVQEAALQVLAALTQSGQAGRWPCLAYSSSSRWAHARPCLT